MSEDIETLDLTTDDALLSSLAEHKVEELKLQPLSLMREVVASDLMDKECGRFYAAIVTVWVCTLTEDDVLEAHTDLKAAKKRAFAWAENRGYSYHHWRPVVDIYTRLQREWAVVAKARIHHPDGGGNGQEPAEIPNVGGQPA